MPPMPETGETEKDFVAGEADKSVTTPPEARAAGGPVSPGTKYIVSEHEGAEIFIPNAPGAVKVGQRNNAGDKKRLQDMHDLAMKMHASACECGAECNCGKENEAEGEPPASEKTASAKSTTLPLFNYVSRLHLPYEAEYMADVVAIKSVARDTIRGYSMLWGDQNLADVETEFFSPKTDFWDKQLAGVSRPLTYDHAQEPHTKSNPIIGTIEAFGDDEVGRWFVAQLDRNHRYRKAVDALISARGVGASSDSASQYVVRKSAGKAVWLAQWPWFASALTPTPAEPRMLDEGLPYWKSAGVDLARMGAALDSVKIPDDLRMQGQLLKAKAGLP